MNQTDSQVEGLTELSLRPVTTSDVAALSALNNTAYPAVPMTSAEEMLDLVQLSSWGRVAFDADHLLGFVLCVSPGQAYESENYRYFETHYASHFYIDRIVIDSTARGRGVGSMLYREVFAQAETSGFEYVTCEVNLDPPNPLSAQFHSKMGFEQVGSQQTKGGSVTVSLLAASVGTSRG